MAARFVPCRDVEHAVECFKSQLLWVNVTPAREAERRGPEWVFCTDNYPTWTVRELQERYNGDVRIPEDFAILLED